MKRCNLEERREYERLACMSQEAQFTMKIYVRSVGEQLSKSEPVKAYIYECEP